MTSITSDSLKELTILVVEDSLMQRKQNVDFCNTHFKEVISAEDGAEGLKLFKENRHKIDLIMSDIVMPNMTGLEMLVEVRKIDKDIPCLLATSIIEPDAFVQAIDLKVATYVIKPINFDKLLVQMKDTCVSILQRKLIRHQELEIQQYTDALNGVAIVTRTDLKGNITYANQMFCTVSGYTIQELVGQPHNIVRSPDVSKDVYKNMWDTIQGGEEWSGIIKNRAKDGSDYYVKSYVFPIFNDDSLSIKEYMGIRILVTDEETAKRELKQGIRKNMMEQRQIISKLRTENSTLKSQNDKLKAMAMSGSKNEDINIVKEALQKARQQNAQLKSFKVSLEDELKRTREKVDELNIKLMQGV